VAPAEGPSEDLLVGSSAHTSPQGHGHRLSDYAKFGLGVAICGAGILLVAGCAFIGPIIPRRKKRKYDRKGCRYADLKATSVWYILWVLTQVRDSLPTFTVCCACDTASTMLEV
jgi:hypothetical protein